MIGWVSAFNSSHIHDAWLKQSYRLLEAHLFETEKDCVCGCVTSLTSPAFTELATDIQRFQDVFCDTSCNLIPTMEYTDTWVMRTIARQVWTDLVRDILALIRFNPMVPNHNSIDSVWHQLFSTWARQLECDMVHQADLCQVISCSSETSF